MAPADVATIAQQLEGQAWHCPCLMISAAADAVAGAATVCPLDAGSAAEMIATALAAAGAAELGSQGRLCLVPSWALHDGHSSWLGAKEYLCDSSIDTTLGVLREKCYNNTSQVITAVGWEWSEYLALPAD